MMVIMIVIREFSVWFFDLYSIRLTVLIISTNTLRYSIKIFLIYRNHALANTILILEYLFKVSLSVNDFVSMMMQTYCDKCPLVFAMLGCDQMMTHFLMSINLMPVTHRPTCNTNSTRVISIKVLF